MRGGRCLKKQATSLVSFLLTGIVFCSEVTAHGLRNACRNVWPLLLMSLAVVLLNMIPGKEWLYAGKTTLGDTNRTDHGPTYSFFSLVTGIILALLAVPVMLVITQMIIKSGWHLQNAYLGYNLVLLFLILIISILVFGDFIWSVTVFSIALTLPALVCYYVMQFRGKPLTIFDVLGIRTAANVVSGYVIRLQVRLGICLQAILIFLTLQIRLQTIRLPHTWRWIAFRAAAVCLMVFMIYVFCRNCLWTEKWMQGGDDYVLLTTYSEKGFYPKFLSGLGYLRIERPERYSLKTVDEIINRYQADDTGKTAGKGDTVQPENLIVIMNESFADLSLLGDFRTDREILPYFHTLESGNGIYAGKGILHVPVFGGNTANTEYEVLTGNTMQFLAGSVVAYETYCHDPEYGLATTLKEQGYRTVAIHPGWDNAWNRKQVFHEMGFDDIVFKKNWGGEYETLRGKVTDREAYRKIEQFHEQKAAGEKLFTFCVTIQNHGGYSAETAEGYEPGLHLEYEQEYPETELYLSLLRESDRALNELLDHFAGIDERTMIVFFGDHQTAPDQDAFYSQVLDAQVRAAVGSEAEAAQRRYVTPLLIWTNYEPGEQALQLMRDGIEISSNYLGSCILELAGLDMTPYNQLLLELKNELPVVGLGAYLTKDGRWIEAGNIQNADISPEVQELLTDYRIMQYNNVIDWRSRNDRGFVTEEEY